MKEYVWRQDTLEEHIDASAQLAYIHRFVDRAVECQ